MSAATVSLIPEAALRLRDPVVVANCLGFEMGHRRHDRTGVEVAREFFAKHSISVDADTFEVFMRDVSEAIGADLVYDSEEAQAQRACVPAVKEWLAEVGSGLVRAAGWVRGERVRAGGVWFTLTGRCCELCVVNPEAFGLGGGVRCIDTVRCGYWSCA